MLSWVLCAEVIFVCPFLIQGVLKDSIGECFESAVLRNMSITLLLLAVTCAMNRLWILTVCLLLLFWLAGIIGSYFEHEYKLTEAITENIHHLDLTPSAKFRLENGTSMLMAKSALATLWLCAFGYMLCYRHLGLNLVLCFLAGLGSGLLQLVTLSTLAFILFLRRVNTRFAARLSG
jgi:hypothetical protein